MKVFGIEGFGQRSLLHGVLAGYGLPFLVLAAPLASGAIARLFSEGQIFFLLPAFAAIGFAAALLMWWLYPLYQPPGLGVRFSLGCLYGGWAAGIVLFWAATSTRPLENRLLVSVFGAPLMVAFWLWIGSLLAYAVQQSRRGEADAAPPFQ